MPATRSGSVLLRLSPIAAVVLLVGLLSVTVEDAHGAGSGTGSSSSSPPASPSSPALSCRAAYATTSEWSSGFVGNITITNTGTTPIADWTLTFTFGGDERIVQPWGAVSSQSGSAVTMRNEPWDRVIPPGASVTAGMLGAWTGGHHEPPEAFAVNGVPCQVGP
jgi:cellulase/cellobiase CelA1